MGALQARLSAVQADGLQDQDSESEVIYLWPECVDAWRHWQNLQSQWRPGMAGTTGLDYAGVRAYLDEQCIRPGAARRELFSCIQACEFACLEVWSERGERDRPAHPGHPR